MMRYWQVSAGDGGRDYTDVFLKYGVMLLAPGDSGEYFQNREHYYSDVRALAEEVKEGDIVVLKRRHGRLWKAVAIGTVIGEYDYLPVFEDVDGWDMQHCRHVEWRRPRHPVTVSGLARGAFKEIKRPDVIEKVDRLMRSEALETLMREPIPERL